MSDGNGIAADLSSQALRLEPGAPATELLVSLRNDSAVVDEFDLRVEGLDPAWYALEPASVSLFPEESAAVRLVVHVPADAVGAIYPFQVIVSSRAHAAALLPLAATLEVAPPLPGTVELLLEPMRQEARRGATFSLIARAFGERTDRHLRLEATPADPAISLRIEPAEVLVAPSESATAVLQVRAAQLNWARPPLIHAFDVRAFDASQSSESGESEADAPPLAITLGQFVQPPVLPFLAVLPLLGRRAIVLILPALVALGALIWFLGASGLHTTPPAAPPTATPLAIAAVAPAPPPPAAAAAPIPAPAAAPPSDVAPPPVPTQAPPEITHFGLNLAASDPPQTVPLDWQVSAADAVHVDQATATLVSDPQSLEVQSADYTLTASNAGGTSSESLTVYVLRPPVIDDFQVSASESNGLVHLSWHAARADRVFFNDQLLDGSSGTLDIAADPTQPLTLRAVNAVGQDVRQLQPGQPAPTATPGANAAPPPQVTLVVATPAAVVAAGPPEAPAPPPPAAPPAPPGPVAQNAPPPPPTDTPAPLATDAAGSAPTSVPPTAAPAAPTSAATASPVLPTVVPTLPPTRTPAPTRAALPTATSAPPVVAVAVAPTPNAAGWNNTPPTVSWNVSDSNSPISSTSGCDPTTVSTQTAGTTLSCSATNAAGQSTTGTVTVKVDTTPPTVTFGTPTAQPTPEGAVAGWFNSDVSIPFQVTDSLSGVATVTPASGVLTLSQEGANVTGTVTAVDAAGNTVSVTSPPVQIDKTPPQVKVPTTITVTAAPNATPQPVNYTVTATDNIDPNPTLTCAPASGSTFPVGTTTVTCVAFDAARNTTIASFSVVVQPGPVTLSVSVGTIPGFFGTPGPTRNVTINPGNTSCATGASCKVEVPQGSTATITSTIPNTAWSGCTSTATSGTTSTCTVSMTGPKTVTLVFGGGTD